MSDSKSQAPAFDVGTRPHGLSEDGSQTEQESHSPTSPHSLADGFDVVVSAASGIHAQRSEHGGQAAKAPLVYRDPVVRGCCRALKAAVLRQQSEGRFHLALDEREFLHLWFALENSRSKLRVAIGRGKAQMGDLHASDSVWQKLRAIMTRRQPWRPA